MMEMVSLGYLGICGAWDMKRRIVPNRLTFTAVMCLCFLAVCHGGLVFLVHRSIASLGVLYLTWHFYRCGQMGGGDCKGLAALQLGLGLQSFLLVLLVSCILAVGCFCLARVAKKQEGSVPDLIRRTTRMVGQVLGAGETRWRWLEEDPWRLPLMPFLFLGTLVSMHWIMG